MRRGLALALLGIVLAGCATPSPARREISRSSASRLPTSVGPRIDWPSALLVAPHEGETFFRRSAQARGFAWVEPGMVLAPRGRIRSGRVRAATDGPLRIRGWIELRSVGGVVTRRGRVRGTPLYLGPGDEVRLVDADGGTARIEAAARFGHPEQRESSPFVGNLAMDHIGAVVFGRGAGPTPGRPGVIHRATQLRARPNGEVLHTLPALDPPIGATILRERGDWVGVRVGIGPYLVGYVPASALRPSSASHKDVPTMPEVLDPWARPGTRRLPPAVANPWARGENDPEGAEAEPVEEDPLPPRLRAEVVRPVRAVRTGTRVRVDGMVVAVFRRPGWAVELERRDGQVEILGAIDEQASVRGLVPAGALFEP